MSSARFVVSRHSTLAVTGFVATFIAAFTMTWQRQGHVKSTVFQRARPMRSVGTLHADDGRRTRALADSLGSYDFMASGLSEASVAAVPPGQVAFRNATEVPPLEVQGLIGGPQWVALVRGVPGHTEAVPLMAGDTVAGIRVGRVTGIIVVFHFRDTSWTETLKSSWHQ